MQSESEEGGSDIDLLYESPTTEENGVKVVVPIKDYYDRDRFFRKIKEQLAYFEKIYFKVDGIKDDFKIFRNDIFQWSELCSDHSMHICLDDVYYPIDWIKLGVSNINIPVGLRFSLSDGIIPLPNRESIKYTKDAIEIITNKIKEIANYFVEKYNKNIAGTDYDIYSVFKHFNSYDYFVPHFNEAGLLKINSITGYSNVAIAIPKIKEVKLLNLKDIYDVKDYLLREYKVMYYVDYNKRFKYDKYNTRVSFYDLERRKIYLYSGELSKKKQSFLREDVLTRDSIVFVKKTHTIPLGKITEVNHTGYNNWINILRLRTKPRDQWREAIKEAQFVVSKLTENFIDVDKIDITDDWIARQKKKRLANKGTPLIIKKKKIEGEITVKIASTPQRYTGKSCKFESLVLNLKDIHKNKKPYIYCLDDEPNINIIEEFFKACKNKVTFVTLSPREIKKLKDFTTNNWIKLEDFITCKHKILRRIGTYAILSQFIGDNRFFNSGISKISSKLHTRKNLIEKYTVNNKNYDIDSNHIITKTIIENNLYDTIIWSDYLYVKSVLEKYYFFKPFSYSYSRSNPGDNRILLDLCKYNKFRYDYVPKVEKTEEEDEDKF